MDVLQLAPLVRVGVRHENGTWKSERHFLDFVVSGRSLWERLGKPRDMVSILCVEFPREETAKAVNRLLMSESARLPNDRRSLFVCSECGDLACGTITLEMDKRDGTITWKKFGYENTYEDKVDLDDYSDVGSFVFEAAAYERTLLQALNTLKSGKPS